MLPVTLSVPLFSIFPERAQSSSVKLPPSFTVTSPVREPLPQSVSVKLPPVTVTFPVTLCPFTQRVTSLPSACPEVSVTFPVR